MGLEVFEQGVLPRWAKVRQRLDASAVEDIPAAVAAEFGRPEVTTVITPGVRVALTAGSRGINRIAEVLKAVVAEVRRLGGEPFIVPAMGSHGGATAEGQLDLIAHYGVTEDAMGCPIRSSMETVLLGEVENGVPVYFDRTAYEGADTVIPIGRVKPHTDFHGPVESGLMKMLAIGLGKQKGANFFHAQGFAEFHHLIPAVARFTLSRVNVPFGIALVENGFGRLSVIEAVPAVRIWEREQELLEIARQKLARLPGQRYDVLVVDYIGKDISGAGMDPNVVNRDASGNLAASELNVEPQIQRIVVRDLTDATEGNATGLGLADVALRRAVDKVDPIPTYMNNITSKTPAGARIPMTVENDRQALQIALATCLKTDPATARIARIRDTEHLEDLWASETLLPELLATGRVEPLGDLQEIAFDDAGMFAE